MGKSVVKEKNGVQEEKMNEDQEPEEQINLY